MKRLHIALFVAGVVVMIFFPAFAQAPGKPMAECSQGKCVIAEADWKQLQEFHKLTRKRMESMHSDLQEQSRVMNSMLGQIMECRSRLPERET